MEPWTGWSLHWEVPGPPFGKHWKTGTFTCLGWVLESNWNCKYLIRVVNVTFQAWFGYHLSLQGGSLCYQAGTEAQALILSLQTPPKRIPAAGSPPQQLLLCQKNGSCQKDSSILLFFCQNPWGHCHLKKKIASKRKQIWSGDDLAEEMDDKSRKWAISAGLFPEALWSCHTLINCDRHKDGQTPAYKASCFLHRYSHWEALEKV